MVYDRAFVGGGFAASVVYSLPDTGSFHQDVVFVGFDKGFSPTNWGFAEGAGKTLQIQIFTEFYDSPQPRMLTNVIYSEQDPNVRASMVSPDLIDYTLDFGHYVFGHGRAYTTATNTGPSGGVKVMKEFVISDGRTFLVESVPYKSLEAQLQALPQVVARHSSLTRPPQAKKTRVAVSSLPLLRNIGPGAIQNVGPAKNVALAIAKPNGVTVDYVVTVSSTVEPTLYTADTTYFVSGNVVESSAVTMESAVFKFPTNKTSGMIEIESTLTLSTTNYRPVIFTAADDNTAGTTLSTVIWSSYTGNPTGKYYGEYALDFNTSSSISLNNVRFAYQNCAINFNSTTVGNQSLSLSHSQWVNSELGILVSGSDAPGPPPPAGSSDSLVLNVNNCLMANVQYPFETQFSNVLTAIACNSTIDSCTALISASGNTGGTFKVTNSILSDVTENSALGDMTLSGGDNGFYLCTTFGSPSTSNTTYPYESVGAGNYYLPATSPFLTLGTTNVGAALLAQLQMKTTQVPLILTNNFTNNTVLTPVAQRDTVGTALGFHYDPIDYFSACSVSNATLLLTNGVAVAYYDNLGVWLQDGSQLVSQGAPNYRNYLVYYGQVQEQPVNLWGVTNAVAQALPIASSPYGSSSNPSIFLRLTTICAPTGETNLLNTGDFGKTGQVISGLTLRDCEVYGSGANWQMSESNNTPVVGLTNNVFYRVPFAVSNNATMTCYNNLYYGTTNTNAFTISIRHRSGTSSPNTDENDVFDGVTASLDGLVGYNAYLHGGTNTTITNTDVTNVTFTWQAGPLGAYYQATNSPLLTNGSTYATNLGLYHYTVITNEAVEGTNIVSRGYHYVALGTNGLPLDTSGDGVPDYLADVNGNNSGGTGSWSNYVSPNGLAVPSGLTLFTPLK